MDYKKYRLKVATVMRDNLMSVPSYITPVLGSFMSPIDALMESIGVRNKRVTLDDLQKMENNTYGSFIPGVRALRAGAKSRFTEELLNGTNNISKHNALSGLVTTALPTLTGAIIAAKAGKNPLIGASIGTIPAMLGFGASFLKSMKTPPSKEELQRYYKNPNMLATYFLPGYSMYYRSQAAKYADKILAERNARRNRSRYAFA